MPEEEVVELKFRLYDGSDIGPFRYSPASTIAMLKDRIFADWPRGFFFFFFSFLTSSTSIEMVRLVFVCLILMMVLCWL